MDRALFPDNVVVRQRTLQYEVDQTVFHILQRWRDGAGSGVASGLTVTVNGTTNTLVDMAVGQGYCPNFEFCQLLAPIVGLALADYTSGVQNFVCLVYTETQTANEANITDGSTRATRAVRGVIPKVYTLNDLLALPATSTNLAIAAQDRVLVCAIVTAQGVGVNLTGHIQLPPSNYRILSITQPTNVTGVVITAVDPTTFASTDAGAISSPNATLLFTSTGFAAGTLSYTAPGDGGPGAAVAVGGGGTFTVRSTSGVYIKVDVTPEMLPSATISDTNLVVSDVYPAGTTTQPVLAAANNMSANDRAHRHLIGSGVPTTQNAHGLRYADLAEGVATLPEGIVLGSQLQTTDAQAQVPRIVTQISSHNNGKTLLWSMPLPGSAVRIRIYGATYGGFELTVNCYWDGNWHPDDNTQASGKCEITTQGILLFWQPAGANNWLDGSTPGSTTNWSVAPIRTSGQSGLLGIFRVLGQLTVGENLLTLGSPAANATSRVAINYSPAGAGGDTRTLLFQSAKSTGAGATTVRVYRANTTLFQNDAIELTINAVWNASTTQWNKDTAGTQAAKLEFGHEILALFMQNADAPWADTAWQSQSFTADNTNGVTADLGFVSHHGTPGFLAETTATPFSPRFAANIDHNVASRYLISQPYQASTGVVREYVSYASGTWQRETTINARWDGALWNRDVSSFAQRFIHNVVGFTVQSYDATAGASWTEGSWTFGGTWYGSGTGNGPGILLPNSSDVAPIPNKLTADLIPKAWGQITQGANSPGGSLTLVASHNVNTIVYEVINGGPKIRVNFLTNVNANYAVLTAMNSQPAGNGTDIATSICNVNEQFTDRLYFHYANFNGDNIFTNGVSGQFPLTFSFVVFGRQ